MKNEVKKATAKKKAAVKKITPEKFLSEKQHRELAKASVQISSQEDIFPSIYLDRFEADALLRKILDSNSGINSELLSQFIIEEIIKSIYKFKSAINDHIQCIQYFIKTEQDGLERETKRKQELELKKSKQKDFEKTLSKEQKKLFKELS